MKDSNGLSDKQKRFCEEYVVDLNGAAAARRAGYSERTAQEQSAQLLSKLMVAEYVRALQAKRSKRTEITADEVLREYRKLAFANLGDFMRVQPDGSACYDLSAMTPDQAAAIQEYSVDEFTEGKAGAKGNGKGEKGRAVKRMRIKLCDKKAALDSLGRHLGMFEDKLSISGVVDLADRLVAGRRRLSAAKNGES